MNFPIELQEAVANHPYPLLFATISGAHLYGFPSPDSDYDLRGVHIVPLQDVIGLNGFEETVQASRQDRSIELDLVTHDIAKFFKLMLKNNGYVLEQLYSPLVVHSMPEHTELKAIGQTCITRHHARHYIGFADTQWRLFEEEDPPRVKPLLYVYRVLLTGIHLMRTGWIEANLVTLNEEFKLSYLPELIERKLHFREQQSLADADFAFHKTEFDRLRSLLEKESASSQLPEATAAKPALDALLKRVRLESLKAQSH